MQEGTKMDEPKLFVGGIAWDTQEETLRDHFGKYGEVTEALIIRNKATGHSRGFGFIVFSEPSVLDAVLREEHNLNGRTVQVKRALSRQEKQNLRSGNSSSNISQSLSGPGDHKTKKIFVGGLPATLTDGEFAEYFRNYGDIMDVVIMYDQFTGRARGFGFITFDTEDAVDKVMKKTFHELHNKIVEVKRAFPKDVNARNSARGRNLNSYHSSHGVSSSFGNQMESSKFLQIRPAGGSYPPYSCYGALSYGYGSASNSAFYGAYDFGGNYVGLALAYGNQIAADTSVLNSYAGFGKGQWTSYPCAPGALPYNVNVGPGAIAPWSTAPLDPSKTSSLKSGNKGYQQSNHHVSVVSYPDSAKSSTLSNNRRSACMTKSRTTPNAAATGHHGVSNM